MSGRVVDCDDLQNRLVGVQSRSLGSNPSLRANIKIMELEITEQLFNDVFKDTDEKIVSKLYGDIEVTFHRFKHNDI